MKKAVLITVLGAAALALLPAQAKPAWTDNPYAIYPARLYVCAAGLSPDRAAAEKNAAAALGSYFRQSVSSKVSVTDSEWQTAGGSVSQSSMSQSVEASSALDNLIGAEIKAAWRDERNGVWYTLAVMEKAACAPRYEAEVHKAVDEARALIDMSRGVDFDTAARCRRAQGVVRKAQEYAQILSMLDGPDRLPELTRLNGEIDGALAQALAIPVDVRVSGDTGGQIKAAFAEAFTGAGFKTGNRNSRFALEASLSIVPMPKGAYFNARYTVDAALKDTQSGAELFTYNVSNRESHPASQENAADRAVAGALRAVREGFPGVLQAYLSRSP